MVEVHEKETILNQFEYIVKKRLMCAVVNLKSNRIERTTMYLIQIQ